MQLYQPKNKEEFKAVQEARHTSLEHDYPISPWHLEIFDNYSEYLVSPIIDVGTRNGLILEELERKGFDASGIEITDLADFAISKGRKVIKGDIQERTPFADKQFKTAFMTHVLEHLYKPDEALEEVHRILDGHIIICLPLMEGTKEDLERWGHYIGFASSQEVQDLLIKHNFEIIKIVDDGMMHQFVIAKTL